MYAYPEKRNFMVVTTLKHFYDGLKNLCINSLDPTVDKDETAL